MTSLDERLNGLRPNGKFWLYADDRDGVFGDGKLALLQAVDKHGSLRRACSALAISYRKAWGDLRKAEACLGFAVLERQRGGDGGGGSALTAPAQRFIQAYAAFRQRLCEAMELSFEQFLREALFKEQT